MGILDHRKESRSVEISVSGGVGTLTINNTAKHNALSREVLTMLEEGFYQLRDNPEVAAIVFTGKGDFFSAGADVGVIFDIAKSRQVAKAADLLNGLLSFCVDIYTSPKPTIAAVNGLCLGGALEIALWCQYIIAWKDARFGFPEVKLGIIPGLGGTQLTPKRIGVKAAAKFIISSEIILADTAHERGLVDRLGVNDFGSDVKNFVAEILGGQVAKKPEIISNPQEAEFSEKELVALAQDRSDLAVYSALSAIRRGLNQEIGQALLIEREHLMHCLFSEDAYEGLSALIEKRAPRFKNVIGRETKVVKVSDDGPTIDGPPWEAGIYKLFRSTVREFAQKEIEPRVRWMEEHEEVPRDLIQKMADLGFFGAALPEKYGGAGMEKFAECILAEELTFVHPSSAIVFGAHAGLALEAIHLFGTEDQKERYLVPGIKGEKLGAFATTEPDVGSDIGSMKTMARKVDGGFLLKGSKQFVSSGEIADFIIVFAQTNPGGHNKTLAAFILDTKSGGFQITKREKKMGLHASRTNSFAMDNVFVPENNLLGTVGQGFKIAMNVFNGSRIMVGACCIGFIRRAIEESLKFSKARMLFGEPMWMKQNTQLKLAEMDVAERIVRSAVYDAAWKADRGLDVRDEAASVKYFATESAGRVVDMALQLHGGAGYITDSPIERFYRDVRVFRLFEGTSEVQLLTIAKEIIKKNML